MKTKLILAAFLIATNFAKAQSTPTCIPQNGLMGYWPLDNTYNGNASFGSHTGTVTGAVLSADRFNCPNAAYCFNGTSDFIKTSYAGVLGSNARSVSFWAKTPGNGGAGMYAVAWGSNNTGDRFGCGLDFAANSAFTGAGNIIVSKTASGVANNVWNHFVYVFSGITPNNTLGSVDIYMNGMLLSGNVSSPPSAATTLLNTLNSGLNNVHFGCTPHSVPSYFNGCLDDIGIWDRVLTNSEIQAIHNCQQACPSGTVNPPTGCCLGNNCSSSVKNVLTGNYEIPMSTFNFNFPDDNAQTNKVQVGVPCGNVLPGKFNVYTRVPSDPNNTSSSTSIYGYNFNPSKSNFATTGVSGNALSSGGTGGTDNRGVYGYAEGEGRSVGVFGEAGLGGGNAQGVGINGSYGGYFQSNINSGANYGIYATASNGNINYAGYFEGDVHINGSQPPSATPVTPTGPYALYVNGNALTTAAAWYLSDRRFKNNIKPIVNISEKLKRINGYTYTYRTEEFKDKNFNSGNQLGFIAQELKEVFPELVNETKDGFLAVNYQGMIPVLLEAIKEQQKQLDEQKQVITELNNKVATSTGINTLGNIETGFQMSQNEPNPFTHETVVKYTLPKTVSNAFMAVYDLTGKQITTFPINEKGSSSLTITSENLAAGIYIYSIVADGKIIDSKRMIVAEK